jgi:mono/diheme cytochrome c family protein
MSQFEFKGAIMPNVGLLIFLTFKTSMKKIILVTVAIITITTFFSFDQKPAFDLKASVTRGKDMYVTYCTSCHMDQGEGIEDVYPPLAKSDYMMADKKRSIQQILKGVSGEIKVKGKIYNSEMAGLELSDQEVSDVLNYVRNSFGNKGDAVTPDHVKTARK